MNPSILAFLHGYLSKTAVDLTPSLPTDDDSEQPTDSLNSTPQSNTALDAQQAHRQAMLPQVTVIGDGVPDDIPSPRRAILQGGPQPQKTSQPMHTRAQVTQQQPQQQLATNIQKQPGV